MKFNILFLTLLLTAGGSRVLCQPGDTGDVSELTEDSYIADEDDELGYILPIAIPVVGKLDDLPKLGVLEQNINTNADEITRLDDKILSVPILGGQEEPLFLVVHEAEIVNYYVENPLRQNAPQDKGISFHFSLAMIDPRRAEQERYWGEDLQSHDLHMNANNIPVSTWYQPLKSCFTAAWKPGRTVSARLETN